MTLLAGNCWHGWPVLKGLVVRINCVTGKVDPDTWTAEYRPVDVCRLCAEEDDGKPLLVYVECGGEE